MREDVILCGTNSSGKIGDEGMTQKSAAVYKEKTETTLRGEKKKGTTRKGAEKIV